MEPQADPRAIEQCDSQQPYLPLPHEQDSGEAHVGVAQPSVNRTTGYLQQWNGVSAPMNPLKSPSCAETPRSATQLDAETRRCVARLRKIVYAQRDNPPLRRRCADNTWGADRAAGTAPYIIQNLGRWSYLLRGQRPPASSPHQQQQQQQPSRSPGVPSLATAFSSARVAAATSPVKGNDDADTVAGAAKARRWRVTLTTGIGGDDEGDDGFMTIECAPPTSGATPLFDDAVILNHLTHLVSPLSYVIRAVFYYDEEFDGHMLLTPNTARYAGWRYRVFVAPVSSRPPLESRRNVLPTPCGLADESGSSSMHAALPSVIPSRGSRVASNSAHSRRGTSHVSEMSRCSDWGSAATQMDTCGTRPVVWKSCTEAPPPPASIFTAPPRSPIEQLQCEIADSIARLRCVTEGRNAHGQCDTTTAAVATAVSPRHSTHPPQSVYTNPPATARGAMESSLGGSAQSSSGSRRSEEVHQSACATSCVVVAERHLDNVSSDDELCGLVAAMQEESGSGSSEAQAGTAGSVTCVATAGRCIIRSDPFPAESLGAAFPSEEVGTAAEE